VSDLRIADASVVVAKATHIGDLDTWMRAPDGKNDPNARVGNFPALAKQSRSAPVTFCLVQSSAISVSNPSGRLIDGVQIYVTGPGAYTTAVFGPVQQMAREAKTLKSDPSSASPTPHN
jgi:hypothetical protein